MLHFFIKINR